MVEIKSYIKEILVVILFFCNIGVAMSIVLPEITNDEKNNVTITFTIKNNDDFKSLTSKHAINNDNLGYFLWSLPKLYQHKDSINLIIRFEKGIYKFNDSTFWNMNSILPLPQNNYADYKKINLIFEPAENARDSVFILSDGNEYIVGEQIRETTAHYIFNLKSSYYNGETYLDQNFNLLPVGDTGYMDESTEMNRAVSKISFDDKKNKILKMRIPQEVVKTIGQNNFPDYYANSLICWRSSYLSMYGYIAKIKDNTIYFYTNSSTEERETGPKIDANIEYWFSGQYPLFYITNAGEKYKGKIYISGKELYIPKGSDIRKVYECKYSQFMHTSSFKTGSFKIRGLNFVGSSLFDKPDSNMGDAGINSSYGINKKKSLLYFQETDNVEIYDNKFKNIGSYTAIALDPYRHNQKGRDAYYNKNCHIHNNVSIDLYGKFIDAHIANSTIDDNFVNNAGIFYKEGGVIHIASGLHFLVKNNIIKNFPYSGITVNQWGNYDFIKGVIEYNELFCDPEYQKNYQRNTLMDGGSIYLWIADSVAEDRIDIKCRYNIVHDFKGRAGNHGIYLDNGIFNVEVIGNLVYNIFSGKNNFSKQNSYTVLSDDVVWKDKILRNTNNILEHNILLGPYRFTANGNNVSTEKKVNYLGGYLSRENCSFSDKSSYKQLLPDTIDSLAKVDANGRILLYKDISSFHLPSIITNRIEECMEHNTNK